MATVPYRTVYETRLTLPWESFQARLLDNQEGANTERHVLGKLSARCFPRRPFRHRQYSNIPAVNTVRYTDIDHGMCGAIYGTYIAAHT